MKLKTSVLIDHFEKLFIFNVFWKATSYTTAKWKFISGTLISFQCYFCFYENLHCNNRSWKIFSTLSIMFFNVPCFPFCCFFSTEVVFRNGFQRTTQAARTMQATMIMKMVETFNSWKNVWDSIILCRFNLDHWISDM